ncbi:YlmH/Sll1252 family protein [uncultured Ruminococcus sp.]|uniref:YlmH/Sll1252 family protein n=1 Tax=uncultured Ruminococcus sp. TaxID=165186 RepID=UPI00292D9D35|nr:YlmH/Sll1252 family protein [uncultured Ruminococcus sp.]
MIAEDKLLLDKAYDAIYLAERRNIPRFLGFLNEHESLYVRQHLPKSADITFFGGYPEAVRLMMGASADEDSFPITALEFCYREQDDLRHRDFLGSLMAMGIRRDTLGDILTGKGRTVIFVRDDIVPFLLSDVDKIGRVGVKVGYADVDDLPIPDDIEELLFTLSSLRLDAFVAAAAHLSRDKAARLIKNELVMVDHVTDTEVSSQLKEGMTVTIRKHGKYVLAELRGTSKKGKLRLSVKHYR